MVAQDLRPRQIRRNMSFWEYAGIASIGLWALIILIKSPRISCRLGLHRWKYLEVFMVIPGMARMICLRCGRIDYHEGNAP